MSWKFWQRRKKDTPALSSGDDGAEREQPRAGVATAPRPGGLSGKLTAPLAELDDELLRFTRDTLNAQGVRVRVEEDDLLVAIQPDGATTRYTTTLARARAEEETTLLAQGAAALTSLFDEAAQRARVVALRLPTRGEDPATLARDHLASLAECCGRCIGQGNGHSAEPWLAGAPSCDACPLRAGGVALSWAQPPTAARVTRQGVAADVAQSVELVYRLIGRDRRGRRDEWLRLAFDASGRPLAPLSLDLLAAAQPDDEAIASARLAATNERAQERLRPALDALSASLQLRVADDYQRRVMEVTATHERLRRERPEEGDAIAAALDRELASLAEVYAVEVEARLESVVFISAPTAQVALQMEQGSLSVVVDLGRGTVGAPACTVCGAEVRAGHICAHGHALCASHLASDSCGQCGAVRCPVCAPKAPLARCALCGEATCDECATRCDECAGAGKGDGADGCGRVYCASHTWRCAEGDHTLCLEHLSLCSACGDTLCAAHTSYCGACDDALCAHHSQRCVTCGEPRCATHALACVTCGHSLCAAHTTRCEQCGQPVCGADVFTCLGCGRALCGCAGLGACASCGADYCARCRGEAETCPACRALADPDADDLRALGAAAEREPAINLKRKWQVGRNALARVYIARGLGREEAWVVSDAGEVIGARRKGWLAR